MSRHNKFTFICSNGDRRRLASLAKRLTRSQSDTVRLLIREADRNLLARMDLVQARARWLTELHLKLLQLLPVVVKAAIDIGQTGKAEPYVTLAIYIVLTLILFWPGIR